MESSPETGKTADISRRHHWIPREMTSEKRAQKFHSDDVSLRIYPDQCSAFVWSCCMGNFFQPIRISTQISVVTRYHHRISKLVSLVMSARGNH